MLLEDIISSQLLAVTNEYISKVRITMEFFTREWFNLREGSDIDLFMCVTKPAETFSEEYFQNLYHCMLKQHLRLYKEMSELTADDVFQPGRWDSLTIVNDEGGFTDASQFLSPEELERIRDDIHHKEQEAYDNFVPQVYDEEVLTKQFDDNMYCRKKQLEALLPEDILKDVADIRVLALNKVSENIKIRIRQFCAQKEEKVIKLQQEFQNHYSSIVTQLPEKIRNEYGFHDCKVTRFEQQGTDVIIELDHRGGFTNVCKLINHNATIIEQDNIEGSWWIYDEIYIMNDSYEFHAALQDENGQVRYFTVNASDIDFIKETGSNSITN